MKKIRTLSIDIETYSDMDLQKCGVYKYAQSPAFEILLFGVSVNGGIGRISGVLIGVLVFEILKTCLQYLGVDTNYQYIAQGIVIVVAIALDIRKYIAKK